MWPSVLSDSWSLNIPATLMIIGNYNHSSFIGNSARFIPLLWISADPEKSSDDGCDLLHFPVPQELWALILPHFILNIFKHFCKWVEWNNIMNPRMLIIWFLTMNTILIYFSIYLVLCWLKYFKVNVRQMTFLPPNIYVCLFFF